MNGLLLAWYFSLCSCSALQAEPGEAAVLRARAFDAAYSLDHDRAVALFTDALASAPDDIAAHRGIATVQWLEITFARGTISADEFLGDARPAGNPPPASPERARTFHHHAARALQLAEAWARRRPDDAEAHYQLGAVVGLRASYTATVEGRIFAAFRSAKRAFDEHERVLDLDPRRKDAGLIVGTYRYLVSTLWGPTRAMAYLAGFGGGRERGLRLLESAAAHPSDAQTEAKLGLVLLYNREGRFHDASRVLADLRTRYPRNRLLWLESAATALRGGRAHDAGALLDEAEKRFAGDTRPRAFGEAALWHYTRGIVRLQTADLPGARASLDEALTGDARPWVRARTHLAIGKLSERTGDPAAAARSYETAARLGAIGRDPVTAAEARRRRARLPGR
jgi:tetratricopeptide (TPR) repeat protein